MKKKSGEKKPVKERQLAVGVYLDKDTNKRLNLAINKEKEKQINSGKKPTFSKSGLCTELLEKWLNNHGY